MQSATGRCSLCLTVSSQSRLVTQAGHVNLYILFLSNVTKFKQTVGVIISTVQNPTSFDNFSVNGEQQFVRNFAREESAGVFTIPLNISAANVTGATNGANVTIQVCRNVSSC